MGIYSNTAAVLCNLRQGGIISSALFGRRQTVVPRTYSAFIPVAHKIGSSLERVGKKEQKL